jgi:hypothetical protein
LVAVAVVAPARSLRQVRLHRVGLVVAVRATLKACSRLASCLLRLTLLWLRAALLARRWPLLALVMRAARAVSRSLGQIQTWAFFWLPVAAVVALVVNLRPILAVVGEVVPIFLLAQAATEPMRQAVVEHMAVPRALLAAGILVISIQLGAAADQVERTAQREHPLGQRYMAHPVGPPEVVSLQLPQPLPAALATPRSTRKVRVTAGLSTVLEA